MNAVGPLVSIIIVSWNTCELLADCLASIYQHPPQAPFEVWVVDNASTDGSPAMVRETFQKTVLIENQENRGFAAANNQALMRCRGELVLFLNSDATLQPGSLQEMIEFMDQHPEAGALGGMLLNPDGSFQASYAPFPSLFSEFLLISGLARLVIGPYAPSPRPQKQEKPHPVDWVAGAGLLVRKAALEQLGPFDERYFMYSEETDLCWRIRQSGWQVWYHPHIRLFHLGGGSSRKNSLQSYTHLYQSKIDFFSRNYGAAKGRQLEWMLRLLLGVRLNLWKLMRTMQLKSVGGTSVSQRIIFEQTLIHSLHR
jgi:GT2 family glycosyltransferase